MTTSSDNGTSMAPPARPNVDIEIHPPTTFDTSGVSSIEIDRVIERYVRQSTVIAAQKKKTVAAMTLVADLYHRGQVTQKAAIEFLQGLDDTVTFSGPLQQIYEQARMATLQCEIASIHAIIELGVSNIKQEVARTLDFYASSSRRGGSGGIVASFLIGAKVGLGPMQSSEVIEVESRTTEPKRRFDGLVVGQTGFDDEFGDLTNGHR